MNESTLKKRLEEKAHLDTVSSYLNPDSIRENIVGREEEYGILSTCRECIRACKVHSGKGVLSFVCNDFKGEA